MQNDDEIREELREWHGVTLDYADYEELEAYVLSKIHQATSKAQAKECSGCKGDLVELIQQAQAERTREIINYIDDYFDELSSDHLQSSIKNKYLKGEK